MKFSFLFSVILISLYESDSQFEGFGLGQAGETNQVSVSAGDQQVNTPFALAPTAAPLIWPTLHPALLPGTIGLEFPCFLITKALNTDFIISNNLICINNLLS